jgi:hypothetical protein
MCVYPERPKCVISVDSKLLAWLSCKLSNRAIASPELSRPPTRHASIDWTFENPQNQVRNGTHRSKTIIFGRTPSESAAGWAEIVACRRTLEPLLFGMVVMQRRKESVATISVFQGAALIISRSIRVFRNQPCCRDHSSVTLVLSGIR